uniref:Uncharacterized protein n=1 Tax=Anguilla anguilla TaxID=7936 RepID=A0A0E9PTX2_ANGAN
MQMAVTRLIYILFALQTTHLPGFCRFIFSWNNRLCL